MGRIRLLFLAIALLIGLSDISLALRPDELLEDAALEARARRLSALLRCPVCQNESIDESAAQVARDLRLLLRERLTVGDSDSEAIEFLVARYGEFILLKPRFGGVNLILWIFGPALLLAVIAMLLLYRRRFALHSGASRALSAKQEQRASDFLRDYEKAKDS